MTCFFVLVVVVLAGAFEVAGALDACANANGIEATAKPIANKVFFIVPFVSLAGTTPAHSFMLRQRGAKLDSLDRLWGPPNWGLSRLRFFSF